MNELEDFRAANPVPPSKGKPFAPVKRTVGKFLRGPIPWNWLTAAAKLPMPSILVGLELWRESGCRSSRCDIPLSTAKLGALGVSRKSCYAAVKHLEADRLISVERHPGRLSRVTILDIGPSG